MTHVIQFTVVVFAMTDIIIDRDMNRTIQEGRTEENRSEQKRELLRT